jgi:pentapeptide MXKDX repeat protein
MIPLYKLFFNANILFRRHVILSTDISSTVIYSMTNEVTLVFKHVTRLITIRTIDKMSVDKMSVDKMSVDKMSVDKMSVDKMSVDKMSVDKCL